MDRKNPWLKSAIRLSYAGPNNIIADNHFSGIYGVAINTPGSFDGQITGNTITNMRGKKVTWTDRLVATGIHLGGESKYGDVPKDVVPQTNGRNNFVAYNHIYDGYGNGIWSDVNGDGHFVFRNLVHGLSRNGIYMESRCDDNLVQENVAYNCQTGFSTAGMSVGTSRRNQWINNVAFNCDRLGFAFVKSSDNVVKNNISLNNKGGQVNVAPTTITNGGNIFRNNLWYTSKDDKIACWNLEKWWKGEKLALAEWVAASGEVSALSADPMFLNLNAGSEDFHLQADSPARRMGEQQQDLGAYPYLAEETDDARVSFKGHVSRVDENQDLVGVEIILSSAAEQPVAVEFRLEGTANQGQDYDLDQTKLVFSPGETRKNIRIHVNDDTDDERDETVVFSILPTHDARLGRILTYMLVIEDND
ncbi:Calx-beta domain-containing protein [Candidatus Poribacteria bacterium]